VAHLVQLNPLANLGKLPNKYWLVGRVEFPIARGEVHHARWLNRNNVNGFRDRYRRVAGDLAVSQVISNWVGVLKEP
jgi:hypothetical protein